MSELSAVPSPPPRRRHDPRHLTREDDGTARVRLRFMPNEVQAIEQAAREDGLGVMDWLREAIRDACEYGNE